MSQTQHQIAALQFAASSWAYVSLSFVSLKQLGQ
jgi:hypothetical protein